MSGNVRSLLTAATLNDPMSIAVLRPVYTDPAAAASAAHVLAQLDPADAARVIPVALVLDGTGGAAEPFVSLLHSPDPTVRLIASRALLKRGDSRGLTGMVGLLTDESDAPGWHGVRPAWTEAAVALATATGEAIGPDLDADAPARRSAQERWVRHLATHDLTYDLEQHAWAS